MRAGLPQPLGGGPCSKTSLWLSLFRMRSSTKQARNKEEGASGTPAAKEPGEAPMPHPKWGRREEPPACRGHVLTPQADPGFHS